jgi:hypothetical protein
VVEGNELVVRLTASEKVAAFHADVRVPLSAVRQVTTPDNIWIQLRGWRMAGVAIPGLVAMGTRRHGSGYDFTAVHRQRPTVQVDLNGPPRWQRLVVSVDDGVDALVEASRIAAAAGIAASGADQHRPRRLPAAGDPPVGGGGEAGHGQGRDANLEEHGGQAPDIQDVLAEEPPDDAAAQAGHQGGQEPDALWTRHHQPAESAENQADHDGRPEGPQGQAGQG